MKSYKVILNAGEIFADIEAEGYQLGDQWVTFFVGSDVVYSAAANQVTSIETVTA